MNAKRIAVYGAGGLGKEVRGIIDANSSIGTFAGYLDDHVKAEPAADTNAVDDVVVAIAMSAHRRKVVASLTRSSFPFQPLVHPTVQLSRSITIGKGSIVCAGVQMTVDISIGAFAIINLNATVGHDVRLGNFVSIMPGVNVSGNVTIGDNVFVGSGAIILQGLTIGNDAVIGAGAVVTHHVAPGSTVVGVPARPLIKRSLR